MTLCRLKPIYVLDITFVLNVLFFLNYFKISVKLKQNNKYIVI